MTRNEQYWIDRANRRMDNYTISAIKQARIINRSYNQTCNYIQSEISKILRHIGDEGTLAYEYRMKRLNTLMIKTDRKMRQLYGVTLGDTTAFLKKIIPEAYYRTIFDISQGLGYLPQFSAVNTRLINQIVTDQWSGKNYSQRIWWNVDKLAADTRQLLTTAAMTGQSIYKTSRQLSERFGQSAYNSQRLIRTETTYSCNQAEISAYEELDIEQYKFIATLDTRTSPICQKLDGQIFAVKDAKAGVNLPAMHPNCRSTTISYFEGMEHSVRAARDKDGNRIKVPADMTYDAWYKKYIENGSQGASKPPRGNNTTKPKQVPQQPTVKPSEGNAVEVPVSESVNPSGAYSDAPIPPKINNQSIDNSANNGIIKETSNKKPITEITDSAIVRIPLVEISGYTDEQCAIIQKQHRELLKYARDNNASNEVAFVFNSNLGNRKIFLGSDDRIQFGGVFTSKDMVLLHNHPRNNSYSFNDIVEFFANDNLKTITIAKNNGKVETLTKLKSYDKLDVMHKLQRIDNKIIKTAKPGEYRDSLYRKEINKFLNSQQNGGIVEWIKEM